MPEPEQEPDEPTSSDAPDPENDGDDPRRVAHELLAQAHAVLAISTKGNVLSAWCPEHLRAAVVHTAAEVAIAVGEVHTAIASGEHDRSLNAAGIGGKLARPKRRGLRRALEQLTACVDSTRADQIRAWLKAAAGWSKLAVTSICKSIPGGEVIAEASEIILTGIDTTEAITKHATDVQR